MNKQKTKFLTRVKNFFKRNSYPMVVVGCALVLAGALVFTATLSKSKIESNTNLDVASPAPEMQDTIIEEEVQASNTQPVVFLYPVKDYTLGKTYDDQKLVYNETLNEYTTHLGIDFIVGENTEVMASYDGVIESVGYDTLTGTTIIIDHGDGLKTSYSSLSGEVSVKEGDSIKAGEVIGIASANAQEQALGNHVHFETIKDGELVNPMTYLGEK